MHANCYLPDELGAQAKAAELPLSPLLQDAVRQELHRREMEEVSTDGMVAQSVVMLEEHVDEGRHRNRDVVLRFVGRPVADDVVWVTQAGAVIVVLEPSEARYLQFDSLPEFGEWVEDSGREELDADTLRVACEQLGLPLVIEID